MNAHQDDLYVNIAADRFFLIPQDQELPSGDLCVTALTGSQRHVDPAAVGQFEVDQEQAVAHIRAHVEHAISAMSTVIADGLDLPANVKSFKAASATRTAAKALRAFAEIIESDQGSAGRRIDALIGRLQRELGPLVGEPLQPEEGHRQATYDRSAKSVIADALRSAGITPLAAQE